MPIKAMTHRQRHHPRESRPNAARRGYDRAWQKIRGAKLRQSPECEIAGCEHPAVIVDHRTPLSQGGQRLDLDNLRSVCRRCHDLLTENLRKTGVNEIPAGSRK